MEEKKEDISKILEERQKLDRLIETEYTKKITVMFTDIKGSTSVYDTRGDIDGRMMVHRHNEIVLPVIEQHNGVLIKTIGDATMSVYDIPDDAVRAAMAIQLRLKDYNRDKGEKEQIHVRVGLNYGSGIVEKTDVFGDVVNVASRVEALADANEIFLTEDLYREVKSSDEFIFRFEKAVEVKGKKEPLKVYRLVWHDELISMGKVRKAEVTYTKEGMFVLEFSLAGEKLKISGFEKAEGEERTVKGYEEMKYQEENIRAHTNGIIDLLNRANKRGKIGNDLIIKLKEYGRMLFDELVPVQIKERISKTGFGHLLISIDDNLVHIPWELLHDGRDFLCQRFSMGRTVSTRQRVSPVVRAIGKPLKMQVLADARGDLQAAYTEGVKIKDEIGNFDEWLDLSLKTTDIKTDYVKAKIKNFDIVHYAGHADHNALKPEESGWLLKDGKLKAEQVISMSGLMPMPALVFSNACQTGQTDEWKIEADYETKIFGLANAFLLSGVQHYIGTFWEIPDEAGYHFAVQFYKQLIQGIPVGAALRAARQGLIDKYGEDMIVWASYMLYGDPTARYILPDMEIKETVREEKVVKEELVGAGLRHREEVIHFPAKKKQKSPAFVIAALVVMLAAGAAGFFLKTRSGTVEQTPAVQPVQAAKSEDNSKRIDELAASLAKDFREGKPGAAKAGDGWSSAPLSIVFMDIKGDAANADKLVNFTSQTLQTGGRVRVVERELLSKLLEELKLSSSSLADPSTALKIGKVLSAKVIVTGSIISDKGQQTVMLRMIDTETTVVKKMISAESKAIDKEMAGSLGTKIMDALKAEYPLQGKVTSVSGDRYEINLGQAHGLKKGDRLEVVEAVGKGGLHAAVGEIEIAEAGRDSSLGTLTSKKGEVKSGAKVREKQAGTL